MKIKDILLKFAKANKTDEKSAKLRKEYIELLNRLSDIRSNYNFTDNPSTIDALIYEENAALCRLQELYSEAKKNSITLEAYELNQK